MEIQILFLAAVLLVAHGARIRRDAEAGDDECQKPPENTEMVLCCDLPTRHILGYIRDSIHFCGKKVIGNEGESESSTLPPAPERRRHYFKHRFRDGCFVQCLFEQEGLLVDNIINKQALIDRIKNSFEGDEEWQETAETVIEQCLTSEIIVPANETCQSGSAEIFKCIHKQLFLQCPTWLDENEYCTSLKNFYMKCPNGPPPEVYPKRRHYHRDRPNNPEPEPEGETADTPDDEA